ncbi:MAG: urate hydroxylase PuuD [Bauldia sp.]|nr:urate hydroxylase PuuD [Bauldia sp.]
MTGVAAEWLNLLFRWGHIIVGVSWIGTSFYFIALDLGLRKRADIKEGVSGTAWQVHGGGFYHVEKYLVAPTDLPSELIWFRWEAYLTWISGFALLVLQYYLQANAYLIDPSVADISPVAAIVISLVSLVAGWFIYDRLLCRTAIGERPLTLAVAVFLLVVLGALVFQFVFSGRGALIHVGALIGTIMAANVFLVIIPNQRTITKSLLAGEPPDPALGAMSKQRSVHNNYLTLPVLLFMVSNHYPLLAAHGQIWLVVALILVMGGSLRHLINRHDAHDPVRKFIWALPVAIAALAVAVIVTAPRTTPPPEGLVVTDAEALAIATARCSGCHSAAPTLMGLTTPPRGIELATVEDLVRHADAVRRQSVDTTAMPPGNFTAMTEDERVRLGAWLAVLP